MSISSNERPLVSGMRREKMNIPPIYKSWVSITKMKSGKINTHVNSSEHKEQIRNKSQLQRRCHLRNNKVEQPLRSSSNGQSIMPRPRREDIRHINPRCRSPSERIEADINVKHSSHSLLGRSDDRRSRRRVRFEDSTDDKEEGSHSEC